MRQAAPMLAGKQNEWLTPDLVKAMYQNEVLRKHMGDPTFMQAIQQFQADPQKASQRYGANPEVMAFLREFCSVMGAHFDQLADSQEVQKKEAPKPKLSKQEQEDQEHIHRILQQPEVREALQDPRTQQLLQELRTNPQGAPALTAQLSRSPTMRRHIESLYRAGLLGIAK
eukprot:m.76488 g.76488  ORF g.76488 m.76488 type:complete len:171 (-) comp14513_c0_seq1:92-604(-)